MTPFGVKIRALRSERGITQKQMARAIGVSPAYLSALEHGHRGQPSWELLQRIIGFFNIIWDDAEELQRLASVSHPRVTIDTAGLSPEATALANNLARSIAALKKDDIKRLQSALDEAG
ncbi:helix-turn-helix domain-containing protein [Hoeflea prorocentri]|uniref:Helix-turn-helix transcriptional regulator n=1 Tax=Hoeflea prorocentri TaxID=1922333 RepID=A0A9X3ULQ4_9HYPH|nr:helix-turn-helix transcriptional regulator [Hoeflea prorocentri]MCY6383155.1 helix-turn-helix transcriptional regulator [Hoeflea prorocentri]MDA5400955.1 helix-turn-helix transcriptional regulator [Hoeflea prorocentri]